jgi:uncharacterized protein (DUF1684 family)
LSSTTRLAALALALGCVACRPPAADDPAAAPPDVARERAEFTTWLETAPASPFRALVQYPITDSVSLGPPGTDIPLPGLGHFRIEEKGGRLTMVVDGATRPVWRDRLISLGDYQVLATGLPGRITLTVFGNDLRDFKPPEYYPMTADWRREVELTPPARAGTRRLLGADGSEVEATDAGTVSLPVADTTVTLQVFRVPLPGGEESELEIYFRDGTNGDGTYPAGRFVSLVPAGGKRYQLDFNRARNPFCAFSAVYACPAPWRGNAVPDRVEAGQLYSGGGLDVPVNDPGGPS